MAIDYIAVLEDLRERRAKLDTAIAAIEEMVGVASAKLEVRSPDAAPTVDRFDGMSLTEAIVVCLREAKHPETAAEIAKRLEEGGYASRSQNFYNTVYTTLKREADQTAGQIRRVDRGWGLRIWPGPVTASNALLPPSDAFADRVPQSDASDN